jgi:flagellar assembly factor FliW
MSYEVRGTILGFEDTVNIEIEKVDELFSTMNDTSNKSISFTLVNPYALREYSFDVPSDIKVLLDINADSNISVYNVVIIQTPLENSTVNFLAPIIVNNDTKRVAQAVLNPKRHPDFGMTETIKSFKS